MTNYLYVKRVYNSEFTKETPLGSVVKINPDNATIETDRRTWSTSIRTIKEHFKCLDTS